MRLEAFKCDLNGAKQEVVSEKNAEAPLRSQCKFMTPHKAALSQTPLEPASDRAGEDGPGAHSLTKALRGAGHPGTARLNTASQKSKAHGQAHHRGTLQTPRRLHRKETRR